MFNKCSGFSLIALFLTSITANAGSWEVFLDDINNAATGDVLNLSADILARYDFGGLSGSRSNSFEENYRVDSIIGQSGPLIFNLPPTIGNYASPGATADHFTPEIVQDRFGNMERFNHTEFDNNWWAYLQLLDPNKSNELTINSRTTTVIDYRASFDNPVPVGTTFLDGSVISTVGLFGGPSNGPGYVAGQGFGLTCAGGFFVRECGSIAPARASAASVVSTQVGASFLEDRAVRARALPPEEQLITVTDQINLNARNGATVSGAVYQRQEIEVTGGVLGFEPNFEQYKRLSESKNAVERWETAFIFLGLLLIAWPLAATLLTPAAPLAALPLLSILSGIATVGGAVTSILNDPPRLDFEEVAEYQYAIQDATLGGTVAPEEIERAVLNSVAGLSELFEDYLASTERYMGALGTGNFVEALAQFEAQAVFAEQSIEEVATLSNTLADTGFIDSLYEYLLAAMEVDPNIFDQLIVDSVLDEFPTEVQVEGLLSDLMFLPSEANVLPETCSSSARQSTLCEALIFNNQTTVPVPNIIWLMLFGAIIVVRKRSLQRGSRA